MTGASTCWMHRHHLDPTYNRVILHVVFWNDAKEATTLSNGQKVPTLALQRFMKTPVYHHANYATNWHLPRRRAAGCRVTVSEANSWTQPKKKDSSPRPVVSRRL